MIKKEAFFSLLLGYGYMRNNLAYLGEYSTHGDVADMPKGDDALTEIAPFEAK